MIEVGDIVHRIRYPQIAGEWTDGDRITVYGRLNHDYEVTRISPRGININYRDANNHYTGTASNFRLAKKKVIRYLVTYMSRPNLLDGNFDRTSSFVSNELADANSLVNELQRSGRIILAKKKITSYLTIPDLNNNGV